MIVTFKTAEAVARRHIFNSIKIEYCRHPPDTFCGDWYLFKFCIVLEGLEPAINYLGVSKHNGSIKYIGSDVIDEDKA